MQRKRVCKSDFFYVQSRLDILKIHSRRMNLMRGIDLKKIAEKMGGASGAELKVCLSLLCFFSFLFRQFS